MKILFVVSENFPKSPVFELAEAAKKRIGRDAAIVYYDGSPLRTYGKIEGLWIFTHEERGGCPENVRSFLENNFSAIEDVPSVATGVGGKEGGMNAVSEIMEFFEEHGGRYLSDSEPLCIPLRSSRLDLDHEEKMDLFFLVDSFLKYCGMDESDSRKIAFEKVVDNYFAILKYLTDEKPELLSWKEDVMQTDHGSLDLSDLSEAPAGIRDLRSEINELSKDYELEEEEILPALREKIDREW